MLVKRYLTDPVFHEVASSTQTVTLMEHRFLQVHQMDKVKVAAAICRAQEKSLLFVRTKRGADRLVENLGKEGIRAAAIHGDLRQTNRERALSDFSNGKLSVLVATDVAARGLHIDGVDGVIHYDPPEDHKAYLHRSGRTARAGKAGVVVSLSLVEPAGRDGGDPAPARPAHPHRRDVLQRSTAGRPGRLDAVARRERALSEEAPVALWSPEDGVRRVLVVTAHPDDVDFGAAGTVAAFTAAGLEVTYCIVTNGEAGGSDRSLSRVEMAALRQDEQRAAAAVVGVSDVHFLGHPDGRVEATQELRRDISRVIRQVRPERVLTQSPERNWDFIYASHPDHLAAGEAAVCAVYPDARNPFAHPELLDVERLEPWTVPELWIMGPPGTTEVTIAVETTGTVERKVEALMCHKSQIGDPEAIRERVLGGARAGGERAGLPEGIVGRAVPGHPHPLKRHHGYR